MPEDSTVYPKPADPFADFRNFMWHVWKHLELPDPTPVQYDMALWCQHGPRRAVTEAFRGVGKSWITSAYVVWLLLRDPQLKIMVVSASKERADAFSTFTMRLILDMPVLQHLTPTGDQRNSKIAFDVGPSRADHSPSVKSVGITGQMAGSRADLIVADDVEVPNNSATQGQRDKLAESVKEFDAILKPGGRIMYLGTPQCEASLYNQLPERGYTVRIWPALVPTEIQVAGYGPALAPYVLDKIARGAIPGQSMDPKRFTTEDLTERGISYGRAGFALQFMLDTRLSDGERYPLKLADLIIMDVAPDMAPAKLIWASSPDLLVADLPTVGMTGDRFYRPMWTSKEFAPFTGTVMQIDPSGRGKDETAYAIVKFLHGYLFLVAIGGFTNGYAIETLQALAALALQHGVNTVQVEANMGDGMFTELLKPVMHKIHPCQIEDVKVMGQKEKRILDILEPVIASHKLIVDPKVIRRDFESVSGYPLERQHHYRLFHQMTRITSQRGALAQDDRLDALAGAVGFWTQHMARDADKAEEGVIEEARRKEHDKFLASFRGHRPKDRSWVRI